MSFVPEDVLMSFRVAGMALCDVRCVSAGMCVHDHREGKGAVPMGKVTKTIPLGISSKECDNPGCAKNVFLQKWWFLHVANPGSSIFCKGILGHDFLERAF